MLTDEELMNLRSDHRYKTILKNGLEKIGSNIIRSGDGEFRTDTTFFLKAFHSFFKSNLIQKELSACVEELISKLLDHELEIELDPDEIKNLCEMSEYGFIWMRYEVAQVEALFQKCYRMITKPEFRNLVKEFSHFGGNKNTELNRLTKKLNELKRDTLISIKTKGLYNNLFELQREEFYQNYRTEIQNQFLGSNSGGFLGLPHSKPQIDEREDRKLLKKPPSKDVKDGGDNNG